MSEPPPLEIEDARLLLLLDEHPADSAGAILGRSADQISDDLAELERRLGTTLFARSDRALVPNAAGDAIIELARATIGHYERLLATVGSYGGRPHSNTLRIGANSYEFVGATIALARGSFPHRRLTPVREQSSVNLDAMLQRGVMDAALVGVHPGIDDECPPDLAQTWVVQRMPFLILMNQDHPRAQQPDVSIAELSDSQWLLPPGEPDGTWIQLNELFQRAGYVPRAPLGHADALEHVDHIVSGLSVAADVPTSLVRDERITRVPVRDAELCGGLLLRWQPAKLSATEAHSLARYAARAFANRVTEINIDSAWWHRTPQYRPTISPALLTPTWAEHSD